MKPTLFWRRFRPWFIEYASAVLFVAVAAVLTACLRHACPATPNSLFFCAVILSAWRGGMGPGLLTSVLSCVAIVFYLPPESLLSPSIGSETARFLIFLVASLFISGLSSKQRQAEAALRGAHDELEQRVDERTRELTAANEELISECAERKRVEKALRTSEARLEEAQRVAHIGHWERDPLTDQIICSDETFRILGMQPRSAPLSLAELRQAIHPDDRPLQKQIQDEAQAGKRPYDVTYRVLWPDGQVRSVHALGNISWDQSNRPALIFGTVQDTTESKRAEGLVRAKDQEIKAIVDNSPDPIARFDRELRRLYVNPAFIKIHRLPEEALLGQKLGSSVKAGAVDATVEEMEILEKSLRQVWKTGQPVDFETTWPLPTGRRVYDVHLEPEFDGQGSLASVLSIAHDITNLKESLARLRQAEMELARAARIATMGELTASIAHEVNQPLAAVVTNANAVARWLAATPPNLAEAGDAVQRIARDGARASEVIRRIRALVKKSEPVRAQLNLNDLVRETIALTQPEITRRRVTLQTGLASELPPIPADRVQLQQVLLNLMMNALDSMSDITDRPRLLRIGTDHPDPHTVHVSVQDSGVGIDPLHAAHLYDPFYTTKPDGLGLGLAISRSIVEAHGGNLWAAPNADHGVTFQFTLPIQSGDPA